MKIKKGQKIYYIKDGSICLGESVNIYKITQQQKEEQQKLAILNKNNDIDTVNVNEIFLSRENCFDSLKKQIKLYKKFAIENLLTNVRELLKTLRDENNLE